MSKRLYSNPLRIIEQVSTAEKVCTKQAAWNTNLNLSTRWVEINTPPTPVQSIPDKVYSTVIFDSSWVRMRILNRNLRIIAIAKENIPIKISAFWWIVIKSTD